jgi:hypothetical protein
LKSFGLLEFPNGIGELPGARHGNRHCTRAANGVNQVVVTQHAARAEAHRPAIGVDLDGRVDHQSHAGIKHASEIESGAAAFSNHLMKSDPFDESPPRIDDSDFNIGVSP